MDKICKKSFVKVLTIDYLYAIIVLSNEGRKQTMLKKYGWYIFGIIYLLILFFCIVSDNQSLKNLIVYIITALTVVTMIYIDKKY